MKKARVIWLFALIFSSISLVGCNGGKTPLIGEDKNANGIWDDVEERVQGQSEELMEMIKIVQDEIKAGENVEDQALIEQTVKKINEMKSRIGEKKFRVISNQAEKIVIGDNKQRRDSLDRFNIVIAGMEQ